MRRKEGGRPPLNSEDGAMDETALKERKKLLGRLKYKRDKISKLRKKAVMQRIDRQDEAESGDETSDGEVDDHTSGVGYDAGGDGELHPKTVKNKKSEFLALLPLHTGLQYELLKKLVVMYDCEQLSIDRGEDLDGGGDMMSLHRYRVKVCHFLDKFEAKYKQKLDACSFLLHWAQKLISQDETAFFRAGFSFKNPDDIPLHLKVKKISKEVATKLLMDRKDPVTRRASIRQAVEVSQKAGLQLKKGDIAALIEGIGCSRDFAVKILKAVSSSDPEAVNKIFTKKIRRDSILAADVSGRLLEFLSNPEHSRALPGHETVSVAYGFRMPKFLLKKSKIELLEIFKRQNPDISFSTRVLLRECTVSPK